MPPSEQHCSDCRPWRLISTCLSVVLFLSALWLIVDEGAVDGHVEAHDARRGLEDDGRNEEDFWLKRSAARHLRRSHSGVITIINFGFSDRTGLGTVQILE